MKKVRILIFQKTDWDFYRKNKRDFPWRTLRLRSGQADPYHILVSEVMLQQTQADRVVRYYNTWLKRFPTIESLAKASFKQIYPFWMGLGYNRRALALQKAAQKSVAQYHGVLPKDVELLEEFPGIGPYTARAITSFAYNIPIACIETNIRRVFIHEFFRKKKLVTDKQIFKIAEQALDKKNSREWNWALMDYGAMLRATLSLSKGGNPNRKHNNYTVQSKFEGSLRQIRGIILRILSAKPTNQKELVAKIEKITLQHPDRIKKVILTLEKEGLIKQNKKNYSLK